MNLSEIIKQQAEQKSFICTDHKINAVLLEDIPAWDIKGLPVPPPMTREQAALTPEESRLYERFSIEQVQKAAQHRPINVMDEVQAVVKSEYLMPEGAVIMALSKNA